MKIDVSALMNAPGKPLSYTFSIDAAQLNADENDEADVVGPLDIQMELEYRDGNLIARGNLKTKVKLVCSRCLKTFSKLLQEEFEDEIPVEQDDEIDLIKLAKEIFITAIPIKPLCMETCLGLCKTCGTDLNEKQCGCPVEETDPRMAVLKKLLE